MADCEQYRLRLLEDGPATLGRDAELREHVAGCADCARLASELGKLEVELGQLPAADAPESLVARTLEAVAQAVGAPAAEPPGDPMARRWAQALAACVIVLAGFGLSEQLGRIGGGLAGVGGLAYRSEPESFEQSAAPMATDEARPPPAVSPPAPPKGADDGALREVPAGFAGGYAGRSEPLSSGQAPVPSVERDEAESLPQPEPQMPRALAKRERSGEGFELGAAVDKLQAVDRESYYGQAPLSPAPMEEGIADVVKEESTVGSFTTPGPALGRGMSDADEVESRPAPAPGMGMPSGLVQLFDQAAQTAGNEMPGGKDGRLGLPVTPKSEIGRLAEREGTRRPALTRKAETRVRGDVAQPQHRPPTPSVVGKEPLAQRRVSGAGTGIAAKTGAKHPVRTGVGLAQAAMRFLAARDVTADLAFQQATGYWANTYLPGDPSMRLLAARLQSWDPSALSAGAVSAAELQGGARPNWQPFDAPTSSALAVYLHADKAAVDGRSRLLLQVGLQASERQSGLRPAMNVGVVLDLGVKPDAQTASRVRALLSALNRARQPGDRFSLTVAGPRGGLLVRSAEFREGPLQVALGKVLRRPAGGAPGVSLAQAMRLAMAEVRAADDPGAPLGASLVLLVSATPLGADLGALETLVHTGAVAGVSTSAVAIGSGASLAELDRLVLAGQGQRRILAKAVDATAAVDQELYAASRAVARAVRLRIRLQPGVKLIDVLGSRRLAEPQAQRVREAERSIDRRLARNLGIRADRGEDEEGIQIVIPSFYAGDAHVVLLDVVVPRPGPVADVTVRYKDLVHLRNGVARARLALPQGQPARGPLERNVLKNLLALQLAQAAEQAGEALRRGDGGAAQTLLAARSELLKGLRQVVLGWEDDPELIRDERMLVGYLKLLGSPALSRRHAQAQQVADSLDLTAYRRLVPTPQARP